MLDNIYVVVDSAERACIKINYMEHEISIAAETIGNMSILTRTSIMIFRDGLDVTSEFNIFNKDVTLDTILQIQNQICGCGVYTPNYKYHFMKDPDIIVSELDFDIRCGDVWTINTIHGRPTDISKIYIASVDSANNRYTDSNSVAHYISDLFWEEKCIALNEVKAHIVLRHLLKMFNADDKWQEIARKRKQRRDLELA